MGLSRYELQREENIARNRALLLSLGLEKPAALTKPVVKKRKPTPTSKTDIAGSDGQLVTKKRRVEESQQADSVPDTNLRRSSRSAGKKVDYTANNFEVKYPPLQTRGRAHRSGQPENQFDKIAQSENAGNSLGKRIHNPYRAIRVDIVGSIELKPYRKQFGHIPDIEVGTWWETRAHCSTDAVHAPFVAGISGDAKAGAYSVALSGGYDDDIDLGHVFTFTGSGGRDLKGTVNNPKNLRTAPQSSDQSFDNSFNKSLQVSVTTKKPVRVIRGYKLQSKYAPVEGYRYDGLYRVEKAWIEPGNNPQGFKVCKFAFKRLDGQPPLPERELEG